MHAGIVSRLQDRNLAGNRSGASYALRTLIYVRNTHSIRKTTRRPPTPHRRPTGSNGTVNSNIGIRDFSNLSTCRYFISPNDARLQYGPSDGPPHGVGSYPQCWPQPTLDVSPIGVSTQVHSPQQDESPRKLGCLPRWPSTEPSQPITSRCPYREGTGRGRSLPRILPQCGKIIRRRPEPTAHLLVAVYIILYPLGSLLISSVR
jgi:hypothetical protein